MLASLAETRSRDLYRAADHYSGWVRRDRDGRSIVVFVRQNDTSTAWALVGDDLPAVVRMPWFALRDWLIEQSERFVKQWGTLELADLVAWLHAREAVSPR